MRATVLICLALVILLGLSCTPEAEPVILVTEDSLSLVLTEVDGGVIIENFSDVDCIVFVRSPEGEERFELAVGENVTVTGMTGPIEVAAVSR